MRRARTQVWAVVLAGVAGCAYYNGLYNANQLAGDAARAEREGRRGEATSLWAQVAVKAESVLARYPKSKHRDDAWLLQGRALYASGQCPRALGPLVNAADSSSELLIREHALLVIGRCQLELGRPDSAIAYLSLLANAEDPRTVREALLWRGRAFMVRKEYEPAAEDLEASGLADASLTLAVALGRLERPERAVAVLQQELDRRYVETAWLPVLDSFGMGYPAEASGIVGQLAVRRGLTPGQRARLLVADGLRWGRANRPERAAERFGAAYNAAPDSADGARARPLRFLAQVRLAADLANVGALRDSLEQSPGGTTGASPAGGAVWILGRVIDVLDSDSAGADLEMFVTAELLRDSLHAPALAAAMFTELKERHPASVIAPKALLAAAAIDTSAADSLIGVVVREYSASPYALAVRGLGAREFAAVEDSLRTLLAGADPDANLDERGRVRGREQPDSASAGRRRRIKP